MPSDDRAARRAFAAAVTRRARTVITTGLSLDPEEHDLAALATALADAHEPAQMARSVHAAFESAMRPAARGLRLACTRGCAYCCHNAVAVAAPEAFRMAAAVERQGAPAVAAFREKAKRTVGKSAAERFGAQLPCPLLGDDGACTIYEARPLACRQVVADRVEPCREEYEGRPGDIAMPAAPIRHAGNVRLAFAAALIRQGRSTGYTELSAAVGRVLDAKDAARQWASRAPLFEDLPQVRDAPLEDAAARLASRLPRAP